MLNTLTVCSGGDGFVQVVGTSFVDESCQEYIIAGYNTWQVRFCSEIKVEKKCFYIENNKLVVDSFSVGQWYGICMIGATATSGLINLTCVQILEDAAGFNGGSPDNVVKQFAAAQANNLNVVRMFGFGTAPRFALQSAPVRLLRHLESNLPKGNPAIGTVLKTKHGYGGKVCMPQQDIKGIIDSRRVETSSRARLRRQRCPSQAIRLKLMSRSKVLPASLKEVDPSIKKVKWETL